MKTLNEAIVALHAKHPLSTVTLAPHYLKEGPAPEVWFSVKLPAPNGDELVMSVPFTNLLVAIEAMVAIDGAYDELKAKADANARVLAEYQLSHAAE